MVSDDDTLEIAAGHQLIVGLNLVVLLRAIEVAFSLVQTGLLECRADIFQVDAVVRKLRRIHAYAHRRFLSAADADQPNSGQLRNFLSEARVGEIFDLRKRKGL